MPTSVPSGILAVEWLCLAVIQLVSGSPRYEDYLRTRLWWHVSPIVVVFLLPTAAFACLFVVQWTSPHVDVISPLFGGDVIALAAVAIIASLIHELRSARRGRPTRHTPPGPSTEPDQFMR